MADYNIYIHSDQTEESHPTKANDNEKSETKSFGDGFSKTLGAIQNPDSLISQGVGAIAKSVPAIAGAYAVAKLVDNVASTTMSFNAIASGDYATQRKYDNFKLGVRIFFTPFSSSLTQARANLEANIQSQRLEQYRELTGDAIINSYGKGV